MARPAPLPLSDRAVAEYGLGALLGVLIALVALPILRWRDRLDHGTG